MVWTRRAFPAIRKVVQWLFLFWTIGIGIRFGLFLHAAGSGAAAPLVARPPGVEAFLPIGALVNLKYWLTTGVIHPVHPAALTIFLAIVLTSLLTKKSFCSWLCPVGTLSEAAAGLGRRLCGRNFHLWRWLDTALRGLKYLLLAFFVKIVLVDMPAAALGAFLDTPYWAVSDVKMLYFFTRMSLATALVLALLTLLSLFYRHVWCRYLCPYGALLGLLSMASPFKIRRDVQRCSGCGCCSAACPAQLPVHTRTVVVSPECSGCTSCVAHCPERAALAMRPPFRIGALPAWVYPLTLLGVFFAALAAGLAGGHWQSVLTFADYRQLLPLVPLLGH